MFTNSYFINSNRKPDDLLTALLEYLSCLKFYSRTLLGKFIITLKIKVSNSSLDLLLAKYLICFSILFNYIFPNYINAQGFCPTTGGPNAIRQLPQTAILGSGPYYLKVYLHIIRRTDGTGGISLAQLEESKGILDEAFAPHSIFFVFECFVNEIHNTPVYEIPTAHLCDLNNNYSHPDGIDVFIGGDDSFTEGLAGGIPSYSFVVGGTAYNKVFSRSQIMAHEMGHCLGLYHTHHGTVSEIFHDCSGNEYIDPNECPECVDQRNNTGSNCGDYIVETPADPGIYNHVTTNCEFLLSVLDPCSDLMFAPSTINIMSYTLPGCMYLFEKEQGARMRTIIELDQGLQNRLTVPDQNNVTHIYYPTIYGIDMTMPGDIYIHTGAELNINGCIISMPWRSKVVVERGSKLVLNQGTLTKACGAPDWQGVHVQGNASLEQPEPNTGSLQTNQAGIVYLTNSSNIEWARTAISTTKPGGYFGDYFGGLIYAENSSFNYNRRVAEFMKYDKVNKSKFIDCSLDGFNRFNSVGVTIWDCDGITFNLNDIKNLKIGGIYTIDGSAIVKNGNIFSNCGDAIYSMATYPASASMEIGALGINPNVFTSNTRHIRSTNSGPYNRFDIINNDFLQAPGRGIEIVGPSLYDIAFNFFSLHSVGVYISDCGSLSNLSPSYIRRNEFNTQTMGIEAVSENREMQFLCNEFNTRTDFYLHKGNTVSSLGAISIYQGSFEEPANNCFTRPKILFDIRSPYNSTLAFDYYSYDEISCRRPISIGNYQKENSNNIIDCLGGPEGFGPFEITRLQELRDLIDNFGQPATQEEEIQLAKLKREKSYILSVLLKEAIFSGEFFLLDTLLSGEDEVLQNLIRYSSYVNRTLYDDAQTILNLLPDNFEFNEFKSIQQINLARMVNDSNYTLISSDSSFLSLIAHSESPNRGYARAMLYHLKGIDIMEPSYEEPEGLINDNLEYSYEESVTLFPNPSQNHLEVTFLKKPNGKFSYNIISINGQTLIEGELCSNGKSTIDVSLLNSGFYLFKLMSKEPGEIKLFKFIVQK